MNPEPAPAFALLAPWIATLFAVAAPVIILIILRPVVLWYFRLNENIALLAEIRDLLRKQQ